MQKAYRHLVKWALDNGYRIDVDYEGHNDPEDVIKDCTFQQAIDEIHAVENPVLVLRDKATGDYRAWFSIIWGWGMAPEETVANWGCNEISDRWESEYPGFMH